MAERSVAENLRRPAETQRPSPACPSAKTPRTARSGDRTGSWRRRCRRVGSVASSADQQATEPPVRPRIARKAIVRPSGVETQRHAVVLRSKVDFSVDVPRTGRPGPDRALSPGDERRPPRSPRRGTAVRPRQPPRGRWREAAPRAPASRSACPSPRRARGQSAALCQRWRRAPSPARRYQVRDSGSGRAPGREFRGLALRDRVHRVDRGFTRERPPAPRRSRATRSRTRICRRGGQPERPRACSGDMYATVPGSRRARWDASASEIWIAPASAVTRSARKAEVENLHRGRSCVMKTSRA